MQKNAIILHGMPSKQEYYSDTYPSASNSHWIPWLQKQLLMHDIHAHTPEMYRCYAPKYEDWKKEFERYDITEHTILIGHSLGAGFLVRWLCDNTQIHVDTVILVAPWLDPTNELDNFFTFIYDKNLVKRTRKFILFHSTNDDEQMHTSLDILKRHIKDVTVVSFENYGHFCYNDLGTQAFPQLLAHIIE